MNAASSLLVALLIQPSAAGSDVQTITYYVSGRQAEVVGKDQRKAREKELKDKSSLAAKSLSELGRDLEKRHGKARDAWPAEVRQQHEEGERKANEALLDYEMAGAEQKDIDASAADLKAAFGALADRSQGRIRRTESRQDANVAVEVLARRATARAVVLYLGITPIRWLAPPQLAELSLRRGAEGSGYESAMVPMKEYTEQTPYWNVGVWEFIVGGGRWKGVADTAAELLAEVALGHLDVFRHKHPKPPKD